MAGLLEEIQHTCAMGEKKEAVNLFCWGKSLLDDGVFQIFKKTYPLQGR